MQVKAVKNRKLLPKILLVLVIVVLLALVAGGAFVTWINWASGAVNPAGEEKTFVIQTNEGVASIAARLEKEGLIKNAWYFRLYTRFSCNGVNITNPLSFLKKPSAAKDCLSGQIQAGTFKLSPASSTPTIAQKLTHGKPEDTWTKIVEGLRVEEVGALLAKQYKFSADDFLKVAKEGYMFPDTYLFRTDSTAAEVAAKMRANFDKKFTSQIQEGIQKQGLSLSEGVTLASIVQRESGHSEDSALIASVFLNRINVDMDLGSDVTVQYALGYSQAEKTWWKKDLDFNDLAIDSPYNTRLFVGMPPAPICNPGLAALKAVAQPTQSDYFYFLYDSEGNAHFAKTLSEHNANKAKYL